MSLISPIGPILPNTPRPTPVNTITPFTYRSAASYQEQIEQLRRYMNDQIIGHLNTELPRIMDEIGAMLIDQSVNVDAVIAELIQQVNAAVEQIINDSIEVQDPVFAALLADQDSDTFAALALILNNIIVIDPDDEGTYLINPPMPIPPGSDLVEDPADPGFFIPGDN